MLGAAKGEMYLNDASPIETDNAYFEQLRLLTFDIRNLLSLRGETYAGFFQREQGPALAFKVDSVETRQANVTTVKLHRAAKDGSGRR